jgi:hypothetical protein
LTHDAAPGTSPAPSPWRSARLSSPPPPAIDSGHEQRIIEAIFERNVRPDDPTDTAWTPTSREDVTLTINRDLSGEVVKTSPAARVDQVAKGLRKANPRSLLRWEIPIKARDKAEVEYVYRVYVRD